MIPNVKFWYTIQQWFGREMEFFVIAQNWPSIEKYCLRISQENKNFSSANIILSSHGEYVCTWLVGIKYILYLAKNSWKFEAFKSYQYYNEYPQIVYILYAFFVDSSIITFVYFNRNLSLPGQYCLWSIVITLFLSSSSISDIFALQVSLNPFGQRYQI